jgi:hypothetical protein
MHLQAFWTRTSDSWGMWGGTQARQLQEGRVPRDSATACFMALPADKLCGIQPPPPGLPPQVSELDLQLQPADSNRDMSTASGESVPCFTQPLQEYCVVHYTSLQTELLPNETTRPISHIVAWGNVVVKALCYKPESRGFQTRWAEWICSIYLILSATLGPGVHSASNRNEYQKQENNVSGE